MYLKRLELLGFKSFPDKTIIKLNSGVTSVVGPNGCGKTNILDSIRWVLGEQKVSLLRGSKMEEIIFNGTRDIKPLGMAEVTLVVQNNKGVLPTEYSEVQITRRLFRSGESEYLLNKVPCRLKDITDLFMDTGVGAHIYSVIQQDMIEAILSDRADDRRFLFEEASGISKYKHRKKAAIRKLEATEADLLRLKDIVAEVNSQVNSLNRQMKKAERYKKLSDELKDWDMYLGKETVTNLSRERREQSGRRDQIADNKIKIDTDIDGISAFQEEERKKLTDLDRKLSGISNDIYEKSEAAHTVEKDITVRQERRDNSRSLIERNNFDIQAFTKRREILLEQIGQTEKEITEVNVRLEKQKIEIEEIEKALGGSDDELLESRRRREEINKKLMALEGKLSAGKSDDSNLREQENETSTTIGEISKTISTLNGEKNNLLEKRAGLANENEVLKNKINQTKSSYEETEQEVISLDEKLDEISGKLFDLTSSLEAAEARKKLLQEMMTHYEGYGGGVVSTMSERGRWPNLLGTVAENIVPTDGYQDAVETALGDTAEFMICRDRSTAENIIEYLKSEKKGKAGFLIADLCSHETPATRPGISNSGFLGWADSFVEVNEDLKPLASLLLSSTAICRSENVFDIISQLPPHFSAVTVDGRRFRGQAIITGGSQNELSLLGRQKKIEKQEEIIEELNRNILELKDSKSKLVANIGTKQARLKSLSTELENLENSYETADKNLTACEYELQTINNDLARLGKEQDDLAERREALLTRQYSLNLNHDQLAKEKEETLTALKELDSRIEQFESESEGAENRLSKMQISRVELKSQLQQLESRIRHTHELISEIDSNSQTKSEEITRAESEIERTKEEILNLEKELKIKFDERTELTQLQNQIRDEHSTIQESLDKRETEIKSLRQARDEAGTELHQLELKMAEAEAEERRIRQKIFEEYDLSVDEVSVELPDKELSVEQRKIRMQELKEQMKDFGAVNLLALEEYKSTRERQEFLTTQMEDLIKAKSTLQSTITKINLTARRMFLDTFEQVRENFRQVFAELFTGGEANIRMINEDDPLETPIEIIARPRGKKLLSITQMSGGERALTAISLLFAIYLVKPSPFCILDEIDAPLDDANIHRFLKIIKTFSDQTQFIIITHNKITMEAADVLYGITMEQPGVSRVVSVRFNQSDNDDLIDTSLTDRKTDVETDVPDSIQERMTPAVNIKSADEVDN